MIVEATGIGRSIRGATRTVLPVVGTPSSAINIRSMIVLSRGLRVSPLNIWPTVVSVLLTCSASHLTLFPDLAKSTSAF